MSEQTLEQEPLTREQLKLMAYQQKVAELQDQITDFRVELTFKEQEKAALQKQLDEYENQKAGNVEKEVEVPDGIDAD